MHSTLYNQLTIFHAIAAEGSISGAARSLGMAVPSVSKSLKLLEQRTGTPLFHRTTRRIALTEEGRSLYERTAQAIEALEHAVANTQGLGNELAGSVRGTLERAGQTAQVVGDVHQGELTLEESLDGKRISATWLGDVVEGQCGKEIRGQWSENAAADDALEVSVPFVLRKQAMPPVVSQ